MVNAKFASIFVTCVFWYVAVALTSLPQFTPPLKSKAKPHCSIARSKQVQGCEGFHRNFSLKKANYLG